MTEKDYNAMVEYLTTWVLSLSVLIDVLISKGVITEKELKEFAKYQDANRNIFLN